MKTTKIIQLIILIIITTNLAAMPDNGTITSTHLYNNIAIQSIDTHASDKSYINEIVISKSHFKSITINNNDFKSPEIGSPIWRITIKDLHVPEEACLDIDALLCRNYLNTDTINIGKCYNTCITAGPEYVAYDEKNNLLYLDATSSESGTGGTPQFLFVADINKKEIQYLNTFVGPYTAYLSPNGRYLALEDGWNEISVCNTQTGHFMSIRKEDTYAKGREYFYGLKVIKWINDEQLQYEVTESHKKFQSVPDARVGKIFNIETGQTTG